jgi:hypothetical protein
MELLNTIGKSIAHNANQIVDNNAPIREFTDEQGKIRKIYHDRYGDFYYTEAGEKKYMSVFIARWKIILIAIIIVAFILLIIYQKYTNSNNTSVIQSNSNFTEQL